MLKIKLVELHPIFKELDLMANPQIKLRFRVNHATDIVLINGVFNYFRRLFFSLSSDLVARNPNIEHAFAHKCVFYTTLMLHVIIVGTTPKMIRKNQYTAFVAKIFVLTASYGGGFGTIPAFMADMFGASVTYSRLTE
ncbi:Major Facilitator Superfamily (MFS) [Phytophthora cinnamomi]|uniref:Major Facilitator Superfamily (MFS) n=1 Tax=Phytophthora cinnamomi TaxID=4785 RepID=UPI00355970B4|nr:Major Facilitator Superfamily (MFS) [Phytophthora cinnamomi]